MSKPISIFDNINAVFNEAVTQLESRYPPRNIIRVGENDFKITFAVAGFRKEDLSVKVQNDDTLIVTGKTSKSYNDEDVTYIHRGLANRDFVVEIPLLTFGDNVVLAGAKHDNGLLSIDLEDIPPTPVEPKVKEFTIG